MKQVELKKAAGLKGELLLPPDKSISHRAIILASIASGKSRVRNFLKAADPLSTVNAFRTLGIEIMGDDRNEITINGKGLYGLKEPFDVIDCGNSGTTVRLIAGILAGNPFFSTLTGDASLRQRPMARVIAPLQTMGANIAGRASDTRLPVAIRGGSLKALHYEMPVASAQVKSCLILAGLYASGVTSITEPYKSRDHTEKMLYSMGANIESGGSEGPIKIKGGTELEALDITVPSDFSSAAFFLAAALIVPGSELLIKNVGVNATRTGMINVVREMGASVELFNSREVSGEPIADLYCKTAGMLKAVKITKESIPGIIDEFPILCVLATQAEGIMEIRGAEELRTKESDRIKAMASELRKLGVEIEEYADGIAIKGKKGLTGGSVDSHGDHRIAMAMAVAALVADGITVIDGASCVDISFPGFFEQLKSIQTSTGG
ncbi:MAG TPA: 3-phosphoshikimate 1-carboxyvinyltransferase [Dissulfurispiraceae bacterium]|nr:3-phosphoshikimate 1-carboxyvinyltransferase [Dissulfurispiraceae bacterium]